MKKTAAFMLLVLLMVVCTASIAQTITDETGTVTYGGVALQVPGGYKMKGSEEDDFRTVDFNDGKGTTLSWRFTAYDKAFLNVSLKPFVNKYINTLALASIPMTDPIYETDGETEYAMFKCSLTNSDATVYFFLMGDGLHMLIFSATKTPTPEDEDHFRSIVLSAKGITADGEEAAPSYLDIANYIAPASSDYDSHLVGSTHTDEMLRIKGVVGAYVVQAGLRSFYMETAEKDTWLISIGQDGLIDPFPYMGLEGKTVEVFGICHGYSTVYNCPSVSVHMTGGVFVKEGETYTGKLTSLGEDPNGWTKLHATTETYSPANDYASICIALHGVVADVTQFSSMDYAFITVEQQVNGEALQFSELCNYYSYPDVMDVTQGDAICLYYIANEAMDEYLLAFIESPQEMDKAP